MESVLKKELEVTKSALKLQTIRCRQLVAAFTKKLQEKELELRASKDLKDQQLSRLLRALLILESRLKKEQKLIRQQLEEKDLIIERQEREITKYRRLEANKKWMSLESLGSETDKEPEGKWKNLDGEPPKTTGEERLDNLCRRVTDPVHARKLEEVNESIFDEGNPNAYEEVECGRKNDKRYKDNPVLESVNQILLRDEEELLKTVQPVSMNIAEKGNPTEGSEWYETDSSLIVPEERTETGAWCISVVEEEIEQEGGQSEGTNKNWSRDKSSPNKSQHLEEKACLEMSKKNLTLAQTQLDFEEIDTNSCDGNKSTASYQEIFPVSRSPTYQPVKTLQKPPALPPKPARLLKPQQIREQNTERVIQNVKTAEKVKLVQSSSSTAAATRQRHPAPKAEPKKIQQNGCEYAKQKKKEEATVVTNCSAIKMGTSVSSLITGASRDTIVTELNQEKTDISDDAHNVSHLVRQFEVLSKTEVPGENDDGNDLRKNFEEFKLEESYVESVVEGDIGRHEGDGAETLVNHYAALAIASSPPPLPKDPPPPFDMDNKIYETFLETTGLSQKSILTPSRMLSNHRSCLKPKDVKHRSRVKAAAAIEKCSVSSIGGSTVKYWTEPFL